jgi:hypothetical protein
MTQLDARSLGSTLLGPPAHRPRRRTVVSVDVGRRSARQRPGKRLQSRPYAARICQIPHHLTWEEALDYRRVKRLFLSGNRPLKVGGSRHHSESDRERPSQSVNVRSPSDNAHDLSAAGVVDRIAVNGVYTLHAHPEGDVLATPSA